MRKGIPLEVMPDAELPDAAALLLYTKLLNQFTGASYKCEEVALMDPLVFDLVAALKRGMDPKPTE